MATNTSEIVSENICWNKSEDFQPYLTDNFDVKTQSSAILLSPPISLQVNKLVANIGVLDRLIHDQVFTNYEDLLFQAKEIDKLGVIINSIQIQIDSLLSSVQRLRLKVVEPYNKIFQQTKILSKLQDSCDFARRIMRIIYLSRNIDQQVNSGSAGIAKAAHFLSELEYVCEGVDLTGIKAVEDELRSASKSRKIIEKKGRDMLREGLNSMNQPQVATSLQIFYNLEVLEETVRKFLDDVKIALQKQAKEAVDVQFLGGERSSARSEKGPGRATMPFLGSMSTFRTTLWTSLEKFMEQVSSTFAQVIHMYKVLAKKRDSSTQVCFLDVVNQNEDDMLLVNFIKSVTSIIGEQYKKSSDEQTFVKQIFEGEYPKLLKLHSDLWRKVQQQAVHADLNVTLISDIELMIRNSLGGFKDAYINRSMARIADSINLIFSSNNDDSGSGDFLPNVDELENIKKVVVSEIQVSSFDQQLSSFVHNNIAKSIDIFTRHCRTHITFDDDAKQVNGPPNQGQECNTFYVNLMLSYLHKVSSALAGAENQVDNDAVVQAIKMAGLLCEETLDLTVGEIQAHIEAIILTMHTENFSIASPKHNDEPAKQQCSAYMRELQRFASRCYNEHLKAYDNQQFVYNQLRPVTERAVRLWLRHSTLVENLSDGGKLKLAADCVHLEIALQPLCPNLAELGACYRQLRMFRPMLFLSPEELVNCATGEVMNRSLVLHLMIAMSGSTMNAPHVLAGWTIKEYSRWLDEHDGEEERLNLIRGCLEAHAKEVRKVGHSEYAPMYPLMVQLTTAGLQQSQ